MTLPSCVRLALLPLLQATAPVAAQDLMVPSSLPVLTATRAGEALVQASAAPALSEVVAPGGGAPATVAPAIMLASAPRREGLPAPSIILGTPQDQITRASFAVVPAEPPPVIAQEITYDNLQARQAMRAQQPDLFGELVSAGAFDPPDAQLVIALQTELSRMGCYRSGIDGDWGPGSRASVGRYLAEAGGDGVSASEPTPELFRLIVSGPDVDCPAPAPVVATAPSGNTPSSQPRQQTAAAPVVPAAPAEPAPTTGGGFSSIRGAGGVGISR